MQPYLYPVHMYLARIRKRGRNPGPYLGRALTAPRSGLPDVRARFYRPAGAGDKPLPVLFNVHGGSWIFGDAEGLDLQSQYLANHMQCAVVNIDYRLLDERPFPYQQYEVADTAAYFLTHAGAFRILPAHAALMGYSAGGHIAAGAAMLLRDRGVKLQTQVLCYPFLDFTGFDYAEYVHFAGLSGALLNRIAVKVLFEEMPQEHPLLSPARADPACLRGLANAVIVTCGAGDPLLPHGEAYAERLCAAGVRTVYKVYDEAEHGFTEHGFPDDPALFAGQGLQDRLMRESVEFIKAQNIFGL